MCLGIGCPVDEKDDMARLFLDHRFEHLDELARKEARLPRQGEQPEGEERIEAFAVAGGHEAALRMGWRRVRLLLGHRDPIVADHRPDDVLVPPLLEGHEIERLFDQRVGLLRAHQGDVRGGALFRFDGDVPERQPGQARKRVLVQLGPVDHRGFVGVVGVEEHAAEQHLVRLRADPYRGRFGVPLQGSRRMFCGCLLRHGLVWSAPGHVSGRYAQSSLSRRSPAGRSVLYRFAGPLNGRGRAIGAGDLQPLSVEFPKHGSILRGGPRGPGDLDQRIRSSICGFAVRPL